MARLRQQNPNAYFSNTRISSEFENVIRYLNATEYGDRTLAELLGQLFDRNGMWAGPIQIRADAANGLQYRIGFFTDPELGWVTIATVDQIRGPSGANAGEIQGPLLYNRQDIEANDGQTTFSYSFDANYGDVVVYINGVLQAPAAYVADDASNTLTLTTPATGGSRVTIYSVRTSNVVNYRRLDITSAANQVVFPFEHGEDESFIVFRNGILQQPGGTNDYIANAAQDTITFTTPLMDGDLISIITVDNASLRRVGGMMTEDAYTDGNGQILWNRIGVQDNEILQSKVQELAPTLLKKADISYSSTPPQSPRTTEFWLDTSERPNQLKYWDGTQWLRTSPESSLPTFQQSNSSQYVKVNGAGTGLEYADIDFSGMVARNQIGAANGVAGLDSDGLIPISQLPELYSTDTFDYINPSTVANGLVYVKRIYRQKSRIDGFYAKLNAGTCTLQLSINGTAVTTAYAISTTPISISFPGVIEVDASQSSQRIELIIANVAAASVLEAAISVTSAAI